MSDRPPARRPRLAPVATLVLMAALLAAPAARAEGATLFDVAPDDAKLVVYVRDLDSALGAIDDLRATLRVMGLGDEGFQWLAAESRKTLGVDVLDRKALSAAGVDLARGVAMYRLPHANGPDPVIAFGVSDEGALTEQVRDLAGRLDGTKFKMKKRKEGPATVYEYRGEHDWQTFQITVRDGFAFAGGPGAPHDFVIRGAFMGSTLAGRFPDEGALVDAGVWFDVAGAAVASGDHDLQEMAMAVGEITGRLTVSHDLIRYDARATVAPMAQTFLKHLAPRHVDEARQTAALRSVSRDRGAVRFLIPTDGIVALLEQTGVLSPELRAQARTELGFDIKDDLLDVLLGDMTFVGSGGLSDLRVEMAVRDAGHMEKTVRQVLALIEKQAHLTVNTQTIDHGFETTFVNNGPDAWLTPRMFWGFVGGRLVVALSPRGLADAAAPADGGALAQATLPLARERIGTPATVSSWSTVGESLTSTHDLMTVVRNLLSEEAAGWIDIFDVASLLMDRATESAMVLDLGGDVIRLQGEVGLLALAPGAPTSEPAGAYTHALQTLYSGATRQGLREMGDLARTFPDTPYGHKADAAVYSSGSLMSMYALVAPMSSAMFWLSARDYDAPYPQVDQQAVAAPVATVAVTDPCIAWARDVCYYQGSDSKDCKKAEKILAKPDRKSSKAEKRQCALDLFEMRGY